MSLRTPNDAYLKSRRALVVASGLLGLSVLAEIVPAESASALTIFSLKLKSPENIPLIFFVISVYTLWQMWSAWLVQSDEVRFSSINRADVVLSFSISLGAWAIYLWPHLAALIARINTTELAAGTISIVVSVAGALLGSFGLDLLSRLVKRRITVQEVAVETDLTDVLEDGKWELVFNPSNTRLARKAISFIPGGAVGVGRNKNENLWRIKQGTLEIINSDGLIYSRFRYDKKTDQFVFTNDNDTVGRRWQVIRRRFD